MPFHLLQGALLIQDLADVQGTSQCPDSMPGSNPTATTWDSRAGEWGGGLVQDTAFQTFLSQ